VRWDRTGQAPFRSEVLTHPSVNLSVESGTHPRFGFRLPAALMHGVVTRRFTVAAGAGISVRTLQRLFSTYVGVGPKAVLARYRLQDAVAAIDAGGVDDLADLAASLGWFDQAHFARDFRSVVGTTPSAYLR